jgi:hypothetical protein
VKCSVKAVGDCSGGSVITVAIVRVVLVAFDVREEETYVQGNKWNMKVAWAGIKLRKTLYHIGHLLKNVASYTISYPPEH